MMKIELIYNVYENIFKINLFWIETIVFCYIKTIIKSEWVDCKLIIYQTIYYSWIYCRMGLKYNGNNSVSTEFQDYSVINSSINIFCKIAKT